MCRGSKIIDTDTDNMASEIITGEAVLPPKARFCVKCKIYIPINYFMTDDGTLSETVCNRHELEQTLDTKGLRYCQTCDDFIALDLFPRTGRTVYICKKHIYARQAVRKSVETEESHLHRKRLLWQWKLCWADSKQFRQRSMGMSQNEIDIEIAKIDNKRDRNHAVMPIDAEKKMTCENCVVVTLEKRKMLMKLVINEDLEGYAQMIKE